MTIQTHFHQFHDRIKLARGDGAYKTARERDDSIKKDVMAAFREAGYPVVSDFIQGSLKTNTGVRPLNGDYDVDRALVINAQDAPENPITPKKNALDVLEDRGFKNAKIKKPCVTADYLSDNIHIDFIIYKRSGAQHWLAVGKKNSDGPNRTWSACDPLGLLEWINDTDSYGDDAADAGAQFRRLVRYLKRWRDVQFTESVAAKIYSIGLTVMVKQRFRFSFDNEGVEDDLTALCKTALAILEGPYFTEVEADRYSVSVLLPAEPWRDIFDGSSLNTGTRFHNELARLVEQLEEAAEEVDERKQCEILNKVFGDDFKIPEPPPGGSKAKKATYATSGYVGTSQGA